MKNKINNKYNENNITLPCYNCMKDIVVSNNNVVSVICGYCVNWILFEKEQEEKEKKEKQLNNNKIKNKIKKNKKTIKRKKRKNEDINSLKEAYEIIKKQKEKNKNKKIINWKNNA